MNEPGKPFADQSAGSEVTDVAGLVGRPRVGHLPRAGFGVGGHRRASSNSCRRGRCPRRAARRRTERSSAGDRTATRTRPTSASRRDPSDAPERSSTIRPRTTIAAAEVRTSTLVVDSEKAWICGAEVSPIADLREGHTRRRERARGCRPGRRASRSRPSTTPCSDQRGSVTATTKVASSGLPAVRWSTLERRPGVVRAARARATRPGSRPSSPRRTRRSGRRRACTLTVIVAGCNEVSTLAGAIAERDELRRVGVARTGLHSTPDGKPAARGSRRHRAGVARDVDQHRRRVPVAGRRVPRDRQRRRGTRRRSRFPRCVAPARGTRSPAVGRRDR